jgi:hypothetical protein
MNKMNKIGIYTIIGTFLPILVFIWLRAFSLMGWMKFSDNIAMILVAIMLTNLIVGLVSMFIIDLINKNKNK